MSIVAGDIVRAQREEATRRRRANEAAAAAAAAAASRAREERQRKDILLAASEDAVAEAVRAAAKVVAAEEATRNGAPGAAARAGRISPADAMEAVGNAITALEERRAARGDHRPSTGSTGATGDEGGSRQSWNRPDLWDSLLQSGPTLSPTRRQHLQGQGQVVSSSSSRHATAISTGEEGGNGLGLGSPASENAAALPGGSSHGAGGGGGGGEEGRRRRLAPAELQAHLLNELRLHDDLQEAELRADGLMAAQRVEEARQEARVAALLLRRERVRGCF